MYTLPKIERFNQNVLSKYHVYNSVFLTLPFDAIDNTGVLLPLFSEVCEKGFNKQETPIQIVDFFNKKYPLIQADIFIGRPYGNWFEIFNGGMSDT